MGHSKLLYSNFVYDKPCPNGNKGVTSLVNRGNRDVIQAYLGEAGSDAELAEQLAPEVGMTEDQSRQITEQYMKLQDAAINEPGNSALADTTQIDRLSDYRNGQRQLWNLFKTSTGFFNNLSETARTLWDSWEPYISMQFGLESNNPNSKHWGPNRVGGPQDYLSYVQAITDPNDPRAQLWSKKKLTEIMKSVAGESFGDAKQLYSRLGTREQYVTELSGTGEPEEPTPEQQQANIQATADIREQVHGTGSQAAHSPDMVRLLAWFAKKGNFANMFSYLFTKDMNPIQRKAAQPALMNQIGADYLRRLILKTKVDPSTLEGQETIENLYAQEDDLDILEDMLQDIQNTNYTMQQSQVKLPSYVDYLNIQTPASANFPFADVTKGGLSTGVQGTPVVPVVPEDQGRTWVDPFGGVKRGY